MTWPNHFHLLLISIVAMSSWLHFLSSSSLLIVLGQNILRIRLRHLVWKVDSFDWSWSVIFQHSEPYKSVESTQLWYNLSFVVVLYWLDFLPYIIYWDEDVPGLSDSSFDVFTGATIIAYYAAKVGKGVSCWEIFAIYFDRCIVRHIYSHYFCLCFTDVETDIFSILWKTIGFLL